MAKRKQPVLHQFVDWAAYKELDGMSNVTRAVMTPLFAEVYDRAKEFFGRAPTFSGANRRGAYLKFAVTAPEKVNDLSVFRDWLLDQGLDAELSQQEGKLQGRDQLFVRLGLRCRTPAAPGEGAPDE